MMEPVALPRPKFPILNGNGASIDFQLVADHGGQAQKNHYQSVERLAQRGGLSWCELHAVLHDRAYQKMDQNTAIIECRALEARYLSGVRLSDAEARIAELEEKAEDADQLRRLFDQQWKRTREAGELWRQAHPGNDSVSPDLGELVKWLMDRAEAAEALLKEAGKALEPFAAVGAELDKSSKPDDHNAWGFNSGMTTYGDFRAARAIHDKIGVKDE